ncbi:MAG: hypothetical protein IJJ38_12580 [Lachnospiraceae bacterium]|nr:hypothetical protein [Lachnospiraceae bacterium]
MNTNESRMPAVVAYITWIGFIVAIVKRDKNSAYHRQHINQALILNLCMLICGVVINRIPRIGSPLAGIIDLAALVLWIMGLVRASKYSAEPLPLIGNITLIQ